MSLKSPTLIVLACLVYTTSALADGPETLAIHPAQSAIAVATSEGAGTTVVAWAPDMRSVLGFSMRGQRLWRVSTGEHGGARDLRVLGATAIAYTGKEALAIAPTTGQVTGRREVVLPDPERPEEGCELVHREGVCALRCACSFELVDCNTLKTVGPAVILPSLAPVGDARALCPRYSGALIGRAGDALLAAFPIAPKTPFFGLTEEVLAVSTSGEVLWRSAAFGRVDPELSGVASDGKACFIGSRVGTVDVFDCQRATPRWRRSVSIPKSIEPQVVALPDALLVRDGKRVHALALADGTSLWSAEVATRTVAGVRAEPRGGARRSWTNRPDTLVVLDPTTGKVESSLPLPSGLTSSPWVSELLLVAVGARELAVYDAHGQPLATLPRKPDLAPLVSGRALLFATPDRVELHTLDQGFVRRAVFEGSLAKARPVVLDVGDARATLVLLRDGKKGWDPSDPETFGELHFVEAPLR